MSRASADLATRYAPTGMVAAADELAAATGATTLARGGNAVDAAVAAGAVLTVTLPHMSGVGGDLFAVVHREGGDPVALDASGRVGSGADAAQMRGEGLRKVPPQDDPRAVSVPGCVDGWAALSERFGRLSLAEALAPAQRYAADGFPVPPKLAAAVPAIRGVQGAGALARTLSAGRSLRLPGLAATLEAVMAEGRDGFYAGSAGAAVLAATDGILLESDLAAPQATWSPALCGSAWGHALWTAPPGSQGYLVLAAAWIAERLSLPADPTDPGWPHLLVEAVRHASFDRLAVLHEHADGAALLAPERLQPRLKAVDARRAAALGDAYRSGDTTYLCAVDGAGLSVSLIQSIGMPWGARIFAGGHDFALHNRASGCSLEPGRPTEYGAGRRPPHTLSPMLVTDEARRLRLVLGTMGGDSQPQVLLQLLARILVHGESVGASLAAPRWIIGSSSGGAFDTWDDPATTRVLVEPQAPGTWRAGLAARGHRVADEVAIDRFGHAMAIALVADDVLAGAADPRALSGGAVGV